MDRTPRTMRQHGRRTPVTATIHLMVDRYGGRYHGDDDCPKYDPGSLATALV
jgi:hypothetical protein